MRLLALISLLACTRRGDDTDRPLETDVPDDTEVADDSDTAPDTDTDTSSCECVPGPHARLVYVLSDDAQLWSFDPRENEFAFAADVPCAVGAPVFSMAVDHSARAWVLLMDSHDVQTVDLLDPSGCVDPGYTPDQAGFGLFGMAFAANSPEDRCEQLYVHTYDGHGPFTEGPGLGRLGVIDPQAMTASELGPIDYDGGELAGTGDGRLFAFAGVEPTKLVEYEKSTAAPLSTLPLGGVDKTWASAFVFFGGDALLFTESRPPACGTCLDECSGYDECVADPECSRDLDCLLAQGEVSDSCGGALPPAIQECVFGCDSACFPPVADRVSRVVRVEMNGDTAAIGTTTEIVAQAPIRVVGAGVSICSSLPDL